MKRSYSLLIYLGLIVVACSPQQEPAEITSPAPEPAREEIEAQESGVEGAIVTPTEVVSTEPSTETPSDPTATPVVEPADETVVEPTATLAPTVEEVAIFNGPYEKTYFRGSAAAPVTMIDYSDFL